jgi:adenylate kinase family enzyme
MNSSFPNCDLMAMGQRIVILGPSNAGKSTLAVALAQKLRVEAFHLDQLRHVPNTDWIMRDDIEFQQLHDEAVDGDCWIIEGNYSALWEPRLQRATGIILVNSSVTLRFVRYLKRTLISSHKRAGHLEGAKDSLKWGMIDWILFRTRKSAARTSKVIRVTGKPIVECHSARNLKGLYNAWGLGVPK